MVCEFEAGGVEDLCLFFLLEGGVFHDGMDGGFHGLIINVMVAYGDVHEMHAAFEKPFCVSWSEMGFLAGVKGVSGFSGEKDPDAGETFGRDRSEGNGEESSLAAESRRDGVGMVLFGILLGVMVLFFWHFVVPDGEARGNGRRS